MRIAQIAPLYESVPPKYYGGTERVVSNLTEELVKQGHEVTLFASGDSLTAAELVAGYPESLRLCETCIDQLSHHLLMIEKVFQRAADFDIIHSHLDYLPFSTARDHAEIPFVTTMHGRLNIPDIFPLYREYSDIPLVSISDPQRDPMPWCNWVGTVHHGLPKDLFKFHPRPGDYLAFLGRISPEKKVDSAIAIAKKFGMKLKIAAKVDKADEVYFKKDIEHLLDHPLIEYIGEIGEKEKDEFLGNAFALLFPIDWPEPFGLVMIESMACGTPIITRACGSVPEVMEEGKTGYVVDTVDEAVEALKKLENFDRLKCWEVFEKRFTAQRMADDYLRIYQRIIEDKKLLLLPEEQEQL